MKNSNNSSNTSETAPNAPARRASQTNPKSQMWTLLSILTFSFLGFLDATYLTAQHYMNIIPPCSVVEGCEQVLTSQYAEIFGVPVALFGAIFYLTVFILGIAFFDTGKKIFLKILTPITFLGFAATLYFMYLQAFVINYWCQYCIISAVTSTALFVSGIVIWRQTKYS